MNRESIPISVEYHISTTSDWTKFQIVKGGWWSDREVECLKGCDRLKEGIAFDEKTISIKKAPYDRTLVEAIARCTLNIDKKYLDSHISYLTTKGDIESASVRIIVQEKEIERITNPHNISGNPQNPMPFKVSTSLHVSAFLGQVGKIDAERISIEFLRFVSFLVNYLPTSTLMAVFLFLGLTLAVIDIVLYMTQAVTSYPLLMGLLYAGVFISCAAYLYQRRLKNQLTRYLDALSRPILMKSSEYESLVTTMEERLARQYDEILSKELKKLLKKRREEIKEKHKKAGD